MLLNLEGYFGQRAQLRSHGAQPPGTASGSSRLPQPRPVDAERRCKRASNFVSPAAPPLSHRTNGAWRSFAAAAGNRPTTGSPELRSHPPSAPLLRRSTQPQRSGRRPFPAPPPARPPRAPPGARPSDLRRRRYRGAALLGKPPAPSSRPCGARSERQ